MSPKNLAFVILTMMCVWFAAQFGITGLCSVVSGVQAQGILGPGQSFRLGAEWTSVGRWGAMVLPLAFLVLLWGRRSALAGWVSGPGSDVASRLSRSLLRRATLGLFGIYLIAQSVHSLSAAFWLEPELWKTPVRSASVMFLVDPSIQLVLGMFLVLFCPLAGAWLRQDDEKERDLV